MSFNEIVIKRRKELGLSQTDVGKALGYTPQAVSKFEKMGSSWPISVLPALSKLLKMPIDSLFGFPIDDNEPMDYSPLNPLIVSTNLKQLREKKKITLKDASKALNISSRSLISYEDGSSMMGTTTLELALSLYDAKPSEICYKKKETMVSTPLHKKKISWKLITAIVVSGVAISCAVAIPLSVLNIKGQTDSSGSSLTSLGESSSIINSSSSNRTTSSSSSSANSDSSSSSSSIGNSSSSSTSLGGELPSYVSIRRKDEDGKPHKTGTYSFYTTYNSGYSLPEGVEFTWKVFRYYGEMEYEKSIPGRGQLTLTVSSITTSGTAFWIIVTLSNGKSTRETETYFHLYNDHVEANYTYLPGLCDFYAAKDGKVVFDAHRGDYLDLPIVFVNVAGESFTYSSDTCTMGMSNNCSFVSYTESLNSNSPHFTFTVPNTIAIGSSIVLRPFINIKGAALLTSIDGGHTVINIVE
jgi:transcriptional regulator with XRE-family HTH domain